MKLTCIIFAALLTATGAIAQQKAKSKKEVISSYQVGLAVIKQINPVKYKMKPKKVTKVTFEVDSLTYETPLIEEEEVIDPKTYIGITAEDIQAAAPELVTSYINEDGEEDLQVDYAGLTYLLINAVKEQQILIEELQKAIKIENK